MGLGFCEGTHIWLNGKTFDYRNRDCEFGPPYTNQNQNYLKEIISSVCCQEKCSRASVLYTGHVKEPGLSCVVGTLDSILHRLLVTNRN